METYLLTNTSSRVVQTDFLASTNNFYIFLTLLPAKAFFSVYWKRTFQTNPLFQLLEKDFLSSTNFLLYLRVFFLLAETATNVSANQVFKDRTCSSSWKLLLWLVKTILFLCLRYFSRRSSSLLMQTHLSVQKETSCFF